MAKESDMNDEVIKTEEGDDPFIGDQNEQPFVLLLRVTQLNGTPLPIGGLKGEQCHRCYMKLLGWSPRR